MEFDLVENALHSLSEAISYYNEADENDNADKFKFCVLLTNHCAELLLKEILRRSHPALVYEDIDKIKDISSEDDIQTVGYRVALRRVKTLCKVELHQYEAYLVELGKIRNSVQHYKCNIDGAFYKNLMAQSFSAIEFLFIDVLNLRFEDYESVIDPQDVSFLHEDVQARKTRIDDILKEFQNGTTARYNISYDKDKTLTPQCPICGASLLALTGEQGIRCKMCGTDFENYEVLCELDQSCFNRKHIARELGRRRGKLCYPTNICSDCDYEAVVYLPQEKSWKCLCCNKAFGETSYCDDCGNPIPNDLAHLAMSDYNTEDYKYLCQTCAEKARASEEYFGYNID